MPITIPESDAQVEAQVRAWVANGNEVQKVRVGKSCNRPLGFAGINDHGPLIEEPRRAAPVRK